MLFDVRFHSAYPTAARYFWSHFWARRHTFPNTLPALHPKPPLPTRYHPQSSLCHSSHAHTLLSERHCHREYLPSPEALPYILFPLGIRYGYPFRLMPLLLLPISFCCWSQNRFPLFEMFRYKIATRILAASALLF